MGSSGVGSGEAPAHVRRAVAHGALEGGVRVGSAWRAAARVGSDGDAVWGSRRGMWCAGSRAWAAWQAGVRRVVLGVEEGVCHEQHEEEFRPVHSCRIWGMRGAANLRHVLTPKYQATKAEQPMARVCPRTSNRRRPHIDSSP